MPFSMDSTADALEQRIRDNRLLSPSVMWRDEIIFPYFDGLSIANLARSIMNLLGVEVDSPLDAAVWGGTVPDVDRVVLFISDGLSYKYLKQLVNVDSQIRDDIIAISAGRGFVPLTSIIPSTTVAALTTLWTGVAPGQHGVVGTHMFLKEVSMMCNFLRFKPTIGQHRNGVLEDWGLDASTFVTVPSLADRLAKAGAETHLLMERPLIGSGLSKILHRGVGKNHSHCGTADLWVRVREVLAQTRGTKSYVSVYLDHIDRLSHQYGAHNPYTHAEVAAQLHHLREILQDETVQDGRTVFIFIADHGHYDVSSQVILRDDPRMAVLREAMRYDPGSESRMSTFALHEGTKSGVINHVNNTLADEFTVFDVDAMIDSGIFGAGDFHPHLRSRLGDVILTPRLGTVLAKELYQDKSLSRHGGFADWEMLVPFLWNRI